MSRITNADIIRAQEARIDSLTIMVERLTEMHGEALAALTESRKQTSSETIKLGRAGTSGNPTTVNVDFAKQDDETDDDLANRVRVQYERLATRFPLPSGQTHAAQLGPWDGVES